MEIDEKVLADLFSYHPPTTEERKQKHAIANASALAFAKAIASVLDDPADVTVIVRKIQEVRMLANASITYSDLDISYRKLFPPRL